MRTRKVAVLSYDVAWQSAFEKIKGEIEESIGDLILGIEHVGSTSVEGMSAKPCIDIDVIIKDYSAFAAVVDGLKAIGYIHEGALGIKDREAFKYSGKEHLQMHHLYVCPKYSKELHRHITFRDFLRSNPEAVKKYSLIKEKAAELFPHDIDGYIEYKSPCIEELYKECGLKWTNSNLSMRIQTQNGDGKQPSDFKIWVAVSKYLSLSNEVSQREFHPYKLFMYNNAWFAIGFDEKSQDFRYFKLNRIQSFEITNKLFRIKLTYNERDFLDEYGMKQNGEWYPIKLKITGKYVMLVKERIYGKNQTVEAIDKNTSILSVEMQNKEDILVFVLGFGANCEVLEPEWLVDDLCNATILISKKIR